MSKFCELTNDDLSKVNGGKIIRLTKYVLYNTKTHKTIADNNAILGQLGQTMVNGWVEHFPYGR